MERFEDRGYVGVGFGNVFLGGFVMVGVWVIESCYVVFGRFGFT